MKSFKLLTVALLAVFFISNSSFAQKTETTVIQTKDKTYKVTKEVFPQWSVTPYGGAIFPVATLSESFKPNGAFGIDVGAKINKEVGFYGRFGYYFMNSNVSGTPVGKYIEATVGPRYYFSSVNVKSQLFLDAGIGMYNFSQSSFVPEGSLTGATVAEISDTKAGVNAGVGASIFLGQDVNLMVRTKYNTVFTEGGTTSFITAATGIEFKF